MTISSIKGAPRKFDQNELDQRQAAYRNLYLNTMESKEAVRGELPHHFLLNIIKHSNEGYTLEENTPLRLESLNYRAFMTKPPHLQAKDLEAADLKIKDAYIFELQSERDKYKQLLKDQLLQADAAKEQRRIDAAKSKRLLEIEKEVNDTFAPLVIPE